MLVYVYDKDTEELLFSFMAPTIPQRNEFVVHGGVSYKVKEIQFVCEDETKIGPLTKNVYGEAPQDPYMYMPRIRLLVKE